jgi:hypothetical protein
VEKRRDGFRRPAAAVAALALLLLPAAAPLACELPPGTRVQGKQHSLSYKTLPERIAVGQHFVLELAVCPAPERLRLDAHMPEHRHGMNYEPSLQPVAPGRYRAEGWLFHMPGRWEFVFDLGAERLAHSVRIE